MKHSFSSLLTGLVLGSLTLLGLSTGAAAAYPERPITVVVPFAAGGPTDTSARTLAAALSKEIGTPVVVENVPGAGAIIGTGKVAKATPDGYTLLWGTGSGLSVLPNLRDVPYDPDNSFSPISIVVSAPFILAVNPKLGANTLEDFIKAAKDNPGKLNYGSTGVGGTAHMIAEMLNLRAETDTVHIPYNGGAPMMQALLGDSIDYAFDTPTTITPLAEANRVMPLAVTSLKRWPSLPEVKTLDEQGFKGFDATTWFGLLAPAKTPQEHIQLLSKAITKIVAQPEFKATLEKAGFFVEGTTPEEFSNKIKQDSQLWKDIIKRANISLNEGA